MSDLVRDAQHEFWRPPLHRSADAAADSCRRCGTEFMVGAAFCHICGANRHRPGSFQAAGWTKILTAFRTLDFSIFKDWLGLPLPSLCAFLVGAGFLVVALTTGLINAEFEAIQLWRIQWLIAACAAFLAGILLKRRPNES
jgi:hypothetical protein